MQGKWNLISALLVAVSVLSAPAMAQYTGPSNEHPAGTVTTGTATVKSILDIGKDAQVVVLEGHVVRHVKGDKYLFSDGTGEIKTEIDARFIPSQPFDASTRLRLTAEVDKDLFGIELDVKRLEVLK